MGNSAQSNLSFDSTVARNVTARARRMYGRSGGRGALLPPHVRGIPAANHMVDPEAGRTVFVASPGTHKTPHAVKRRSKHRPPTNENAPPPSRQAPQARRGQKRGTHGKSLVSSRGGNPMGAKTMGAKNGGALSWGGDSPPPELRVTRRRSLDGNEGMVTPSDAEQAAIAPLPSTVSKDPSRKRIIAPAQHCERTGAPMTPRTPISAASEQPQSGSRASAAGAAASPREELSHKQRILQKVIQIGGQSVFGLLSGMQNPLNMLGLSGTNTAANTPAATATTTDTTTDSTTTTTPSASTKSTRRKRKRRKSLRGAALVSPLPTTGSRRRKAHPEGKEHLGASIIVKDSGSLFADALPGGTPGLEGLTSGTVGPESPFFSSDMNPDCTNSLAQATSISSKSLENTDVFTGLQSAGAVRAKRVFKSPPQAHSTRARVPANSAGVTGKRTVVTSGGGHGAYAGGVTGALSDMATGDADHRTPIHVASPPAMSAQTTSDGLHDEHGATGFLLHSSTAVAMGVSGQEHEQPTTPAPSRQTNASMQPVLSPDSCPLCILGMHEHPVTTTRSTTSSDNLHTTSASDAHVIGAAAQTNAPAPTGGTVVSMMSAEKPMPKSQQTLTGVDDAACPQALTGVGDAARSQGTHPPTQGVCCDDSTSDVTDKLQPGVQQDPTAVQSMACSAPVSATLLEQKAALGPCKQDVSLTKSLVTHTVSGGSSPDSALQRDVPICAATSKTTAPVNHGTTSNEAEMTTFTAVNDKATPLQAPAVPVVPTTIPASATTRAVPAAPPAPAAPLTSLPTPVAQTVTNVSVPEAPAPPPTAPPAPGAPAAPPAPGMPPAAPSGVTGLAGGGGKGRGSVVPEGMKALNTPKPSKKMKRFHWEVLDSTQLSAAAQSTAGISSLLHAPSGDGQLPADMTDTQAVGKSEDSAAAPSDNPSTPALSTVWHSIQTDSLQLDLQDFEQKFGVRSPTGRRKRSRSASARSGLEAEQVDLQSPTKKTCTQAPQLQTREFKCLEVARARNLCIALSQFKVGSIRTSEGKVEQVIEPRVLYSLRHKHICRAIQACDKELMTEERLLGLLKYIPTADERKRILPAAMWARNGECLYPDGASPSEEELQQHERKNGFRSYLGEAESFLFHLSRIPLLQKRLKAMLFAWYVCGSESNRITESVLRVSAGCHQLVTSPGVRSCFSVILRLGNYLNSGTSKGQAYAFSLKSLARLKHTTSTANRSLTLLHYLLNHLRSHDSETFHNLSKQLDRVGQAGRVDAVTLKAQLCALHGQMRILHGVLGNCERSQETADRFWKQYLHTAKGALGNSSTASPGSDALPSPVPQAEADMVQGLKVFHTTFSAVVTDQQRGLQRANDAFIQLAVKMVGARRFFGEDPVVLSGDLGAIERIRAQCQENPAQFRKQLLEAVSPQQTPVFDWSTFFGHFVTFLQHFKQVQTQMCRQERARLQKERHAQQKASRQQHINNNNSNEAKASAVAMDETDVGAQLKTELLAAARRMHKRTRTPAGQQSCANATESAGTESKSEEACGSTGKVIVLGNEAASGVGTETSLLERSEVCVSDANSASKCASVGDKTTHVSSHAQAQTAQKDTFWDDVNELLDTVGDGLESIDPTLHTPGSSGHRTDDPKPAVDGWENDDDHSVFTSASNLSSTSTSALTDSVDKEALLDFLLADLHAE